MRGVISERFTHWKSILAMSRLGAIVSGIYTILGALTWTRDEVVKRNPAESVWHVVDFLPHWSIWQWGCGAAIIVVASVLESSYRRKKDEDAVYVGEVAKLKEAIRGREAEIEALNAKLREGPTVVLSNVASGINLRVESLRQDAINVRLVPVKSEKYYLESDVVRVLRVGTPDDLILHCHPLQAGGSLVHQGFSAPRLFFNDLFPPTEGTDMRSMLESAVTLVTARQIAAVIEIAYSNLAATHHYRSSFRIRWKRLPESIVDVEPIETRIDADPPSTAPPEVIPSQFAQLDFLEWHAGDTRSFPNRYGEGHPSWIAVVNRQAAPARTATNVTARLEFIDSTGLTQFCVPHADWYTIQQSGNAEAQQWRDDTTIEGGDEQSFVLFSQSDSRRLVIYKHASEPVGHLEYDKWRIRIIVTSDDAQGFEGELRFTFTKNSLEPDRPAFTKIRTLAPLVTPVRTF
jgi:hypothetical protein